MMENNNTTTTTTTTTNKEVLIEAKNIIFQFFAQAFSSQPPYQISDSGPPHNKVFLAKLTIPLPGGGAIIATGQAKTKKESEQKAALDAYIQLKSRGLIDSPSLNYILSLSTSSSPTLTPTAPTPTPTTTATPPPTSTSAPTPISGQYGSLDDPKKLISEYCQRLRINPSYVVKNFGPDHEKSFLAQLTLSVPLPSSYELLPADLTTITGVGQGKTKKQAEREAARNFIEQSSTSHPYLFLSPKERRLVARQELAKLLSLPLESLASRVTLDSSLIEPIEDGMED